MPRSPWFWIGWWLAWLGGASTGGAQEATGRAMFYLFWNEDYFYLAAQVDDENVTGRSQGLMQPTWDDDSLELYFEVDNARSAQLTPACYRVCLSAAGGVTLHRGEEGAWKPHLALGRFKFEVKVQGTLNRPGDLDSGYTLEVGVPWSTLGGKPKDGTIIGFNVVIFQRGEVDRFVSLAPGVRSEEDLSVPARWGSLVFQRELTLRAGTPGTVFCPFWDRFPVVDGTLRPGEWPLISVFTLPYAGARKAQPPGTRPAPGEPLLVPPVAPEVPPPPPPAPPSPFRGERYILAPYFFDYQGDERASVPTRKVRYPDGSLQLSEKPMEGVGPWFSTLRVAWHRQQMQFVREAGIEFLLPVYAPDGASRREWSAAGLRALVTALKELRRSGLAEPFGERDYPLLGLALDVDALAREVAPLNLAEPEGREALWRAIQEYFWQVPPDLWAVAMVDGERKVPIYLLEPRQVQEVAPAAIEECTARFRETFGIGVLWLGHPRWAQRGVGNLDGYAALVGGQEPGFWEQGKMRLGVVGPGFNNLRAPGERFHLRPRALTLTMKQDAAEVLARRPDWLLIDSWNDFLHGTQVAPSREHGLRYLDVSSLVAFQFNGSQERDAKFLSHNVPSVMMPGAEYYVEVRVANVGFGHWRSEQGVSLGSRWVREGQVVAEGPRTWIIATMPRGSTRTFVIRVRAAQADGTPLEPGLYELRLGMVAEPAGWFSASGDEDFVVPVEVGSPPPYRATLLTTLTPTFLLSGETREVRVWARNDGAQPWKGVRLRYVWERADTPLRGAAERRVVGIGEAVEFPETEVGQTNQVSIPLRAVDSQRVPLPPLTSPHQHYLLRWELLAPDGTPIPLAQPWQEEVVILEEHPHLIFLQWEFLDPFRAGQEARVALRLYNNGPLPWRPEDLSLGYHWYFWDGVEAVWDDGQRVPLAETVPPGQGVNMVVPVRCPNGAGPYVLMVDALWRGKQWVSQLPSTNSRDVLVEYVRLQNERFVPLDLERFFNLDGLSGENDRSDGNFDGRGRTFPAEEMPPDVPNHGRGLYPSGYWGPCGSEAHRSQREVPFRYPSKAPGEKNFIACAGQEIPVPRGRYRQLHILAAAAPDPVETVWGFVYWPRDREHAPLRVSSWTGPPEPGERIGFTTLHLHNPSGEEFLQKGYLYHLTLPLRAERLLSRIVLPRESRLKVMALTLER